MQRAIQQTGIQGFLLAATLLSAAPALAESCIGAKGPKSAARTTAEQATVTPLTTASTPTAPKPAATPGAMPVVPKPAAASPTTSGTIVDVAAANPSFKTLVAAVKAAGLVETLSGKGPFTVFAPTDAAFAALPKGTVENLLKPENKDTLIKLLTYHVVPGAVESKAVKAGRVPTVEGQPITVRVMGRNIMINNARVTTADVKASNGVIHVIDRVILPPGL